MGLMRVVLALCVVAAHAGDFWPSALRGVGGDAAVETFFVISGFYMALVLKRTYAGRTRAFLTNRSLRIFPEYWLALGLAFALSVAIGDNWLERLTKLPSSAEVLLLAANSFIFGSDTIMFLQVNNDQVSFGPFMQSDPPLFTLLLIPQAWTLALELTFYLFAPWLVRWTTKYLGITVTILLCGQFLIAGLFLQAPDPWANRFIGFEFAYFLIGIFLFRFWCHQKANHRICLLWSNPWIAFAAMGLVVLTAPIIRQFAYSYGFFAGQYLSTALFVVSLSSLIPGLFSATRTSNLDSRIGEFSYPIYLSHLISFSLLGALTTRISLSSSSTFVAAILIVFATAWLLVLFGHLLDPLRDRVRGAPRTLDEPLPQNELKSPSGTK
jgi:peptidoglycan/LPS O-acetylase OafA/YrhL